MFRGRLLGIYIAREPKYELREVKEVRAVLGQGLEGDRFCVKKTAVKKKVRYRPEVTLIEAEAIEALERDTSIKLEFHQSRRNLVTRGVPLNHLVGREFFVGSVRLKGLGLCEPCGHLESLTCVGVREGLQHRGGLLANIVSGGILRAGDAIRPVRHFAKEIVEKAAGAVKSGKRERALKLLGCAKVLKPDQEDLRRIGGVYGELGEYAKALAVIGPLAKLKAWDAGVWTDLAVIEARLKNRSAALNGLARARSLRPGEADLRRIAGLYSELEVPADACRIFAALARRTSQDADLWMAYSQAAMRAKDFKSALKSLAHAARIRPENAAVCAERAAIFFQFGDVRSVRKLLAQAETLNPTDADRRRMAAIYLDLKENGRAAEILASVTDYSPEDAGLLIGQARGLAISGEREAALVSLARAESLNPDNEDLRRIAALYRQLNEQQRASTILNLLIGRLPKLASLWIESAEISIQNGQSVAALKLLAGAQGLKLDSKERHKISLLYQDLGQFAPALSILSRLARKYPANAVFVSDEGLCHYRSGNVKKALEKLRKAISMDPKLLAAYLTLGTIYTSQGDYGNAVEVYDLALAAGGDDQADPLRQSIMQSRRDIAAKAP